MAAVDVLIGGRLAGSLDLPDSGWPRLRYDSAYVQAPSATPLSTLFVPEGVGHAGGEALSNWLCGLLPDDDRVLDSLRDRYGTHKSRPLDLLSTARRFEELAAKLPDALRQTMDSLPAIDQDRPIVANYVIEQTQRSRRCEQIAATAARQAAPCSPLQQRPEAPACGTARPEAGQLSDPALGGGIRHTMEVLDALLSVARLEDLVGAVGRLDNGAAIKRLGYLLEVLGHDTAATVRPLTSGFPLLDPSLPSGGTRSPRWGLRINADVSS